MNRGQLVRSVAERTDLPVSEVDYVFAALLDAIAEALANGDPVNIRRFGKFEPRHRNPVTRHNPRTGAEIKVPAKRSVGFVPSVNLKAQLNTKRKKPRGRKTRS